VALLQGYDEYVVAYSDTKFAFNVAGRTPALDRYTDNMTFHPVMLDSQLVGYWRRLPKPNLVALEIDLLATLTAGQRGALDAEIERYRAFAGRAVTVSFV
jgi:hypothetical protein